MAPETGSYSTASTTTHSGASGDFPKAGEMRRFGGMSRGRMVSERWPTQISIALAFLGLRPRGSVSPKFRAKHAKTRFDQGLLRETAESSFWQLRIL